MATKSISDLVMDLQRENEALKRLEKIANIYCRQEFGYDVKSLHEIIVKLENYERRSKIANDHHESTGDDYNSHLQAENSSEEII